MYDLLIRNATICDGTGKPLMPGAVAVQDGKIVQIGDVAGTAHRLLDAAGQVLAPGFIDIHTHYDAQVCWDPELTCSGWHGVTSVIMGNCGVGVAPCRSGEQEALSLDLVNVEAIPYDVLRSGVAWNEWQSFPEYMQSIERRGVALNAGFLVPLSPLRYFVMGEAASERAAEADELEKIVALFRLAMQAGACGFSLSRLTAHIGNKGKPLSSRLASTEELVRLCHVLRDLGRGIIEIALSRSMGIVTDQELDLLLLLERESQRPVTWLGLLGRSDNPGQCSRTLASMTPLLREGRRIHPQVSPRPIKQFYTMKAPFMFQSLPSWQPAVNRSVAEQIALFKTAGFRDGFRHDCKVGGTIFKGQWDKVHITRVSKPGNEKHLNKSVAEISAEQNRDPIDALLDLAIDESLDVGFTVAITNCDPDEVQDLITHPYTLIGLSDAGAHVDQHCEAGLATYLLGEWVRNKRVMTLEEGVRRLTSEPASFLGASNKGRIEIGCDADFVIFDRDTVGILPPEWLPDLPGNAVRLVERATGVAHTIVGGSVLYTDGVYQGGLPGTIMRPVHANANANANAT